MTLSEELSWRGFVNQTTFPDIKSVDSKSYRFYWGVDPSSDSMTVGNLAMAMMVKHFISYGHTPYLLVGGATGMIGDPDGKSAERQLLSKEDLESNKRAITAQYRQLFAGSKFELVDNLDWFKDYRFLDFLRDIGKHVPLRQMIGREFVQTRLGEEGSGLSYAEFSYVLIQAYDFYCLHREHGVELQVCGSDQWGNSVAGVDLIRRLSGAEAHVWAGPLIVNPKTKVKFGKTEDGAVWLDPKKTSPTAFYQFWINSEDEAVEHYLKIFTLLSQPAIEELMEHQHSDPKDRPAQLGLAFEVTKLVHGEENAATARAITAYLVGTSTLSEADPREMEALRGEIAHAKAKPAGSLVQALVDCRLAVSNSEARQLLSSGAVYLNNLRVTRESFKPEDFQNGRLMLRRGKAYRDSALIELEP